MVLRLYKTTGVNSDSQCQIIAPFSQVYLSRRELSTVAETFDEQSVGRCERVGRSVSVNTDSGEFLFGLAQKKFTLFVF